MPERRPDLASRSTVVLTGATGFVGRHLQQRLLADGYRVLAVLRASAARRPGLLPGCEAIVAELSDQAAISRALVGADAVIYCAGSVRGARVEDFRPANVAGVRTLAQAMSQSASTAKLLLVSSLAASRPEISDYAATKFAGENVLREFPQLSWSILRPPALYGPGDQEMRPILQWLRRGIAALPGPAAQRLAVLHVEDFAAAVAAWLAASERCRHGTYALDDGTPGGYDWAALGHAVAGREVRLLPVPESLLDGVARLNRMLALIFGYRPMLTPGKVRELRQLDWVGDNRAFQLATGWQPAMGLAEGARRLFDRS